jgi:hypothetical protein
MLSILQVSTILSNGVALTGLQPFHCSAETGYWLSNGLLLTGLCLIHGYT